MLTNDEVIKKFLNGEIGGTAQMFSTGEQLYSHQLILAYRLRNGQRYVINVTKYKHKGLSRHQSLLQKALKALKKERARRKQPPLIVDVFERKESTTKSGGTQ